jgi:Ca-activated chloride channel family protein
MKWVIMILLAVYTLNVFPQSERKYVRRGNRQYEEKKYQEAEIQYRKALEKSPGSLAAGYNLGNSLYRQKQFEAAAQRYKELSGKQKDGRILSGDFYNLGNALYKTGKYQECVDAYKNALRKEPGDLDAKHNLQLAMRKLDMQKQQKNKEDQQKKQDNKQDDKKDSKDKNKQDNKKDNKQQQGEDNKNQTPEEQRDQQQARQNVKGQISSQDAERILQALENEEKDVLKKVQDQQKQVKKVPVEKNW